MKKEQLYDIHYLGNLQLSPNGKKLSYVDIQADKQQDNYSAYVYLRNNETDKTIRLTGLGKERSYKWLDDDCIVFISNRDTKIKNEPESIFYRLDVNGGEAQEYFRTPISVSDYYFMKNGKIAATCSINEKMPYFLMDEEEKKVYQKKLEEKKEFEIFTDAPFWANGAGIIDGNRSIVAIIDPNDGAILPITDIHDEARICDVKEDRILYTCHKNDGLRKISNGLFEYDGEIKTIIEENNGQCSWAKYVKDNIVYDYSTFETYGYHQHGDIYIVRNSEIVQRIKHDNTFGGYVGSDVLQQFSDGIIVYDDNIYFLEVLKDHAAIRKLTLDGTITNIYEAEEEIDDLVFDGERFYFLANNPEKLMELYELKNDEKKQLSSYNEELCKCNIGKLKRVDYTNDGIDLYGFVIEPVDYDPNKKYPGLLEIHGGPKGTYGPGFMFGMQCVASEGYFVFYTNPRGSDSRGNKFADIRGRFGKEDFSDLMAFTNAVLKQYPQLDENRLSVTGLSYGGYMTNWIITQTNRFKAAVAEASISNYVTKFLCTDIGFTYNIDNQAADPWSNIDLVWEQSPLKYANKVTTPTLFIHSDQDYRCWIAEGVQMYTALKMHHVETRFMLFHGEHHGMSLFGKPTHRIKRIEAIIDWINNHL